MQTCFEQWSFCCHLLLLTSNHLQRLILFFQCLFWVAFVIDFIKVWLFFFSIDDLVYISFTDVKIKFWSKPRYFYFFFTWWQVCKHSQMVDSGCSLWKTCIEQRIFASRRYRLFFVSDNPFLSNMLSFSYIKHSNLLKLGLLSK